ncbi:MULTISPECIES: helix-turn-helix domain-containing protein [Cupriavidus]|uniref:Replication protein A n=4 Tax=Cupriavidus TaxID=106589 RepID=A0A375CQA1_9BURK|nr:MULTISPECIES: helix-turn-helix domain-containing protein [Cupriavidus]MCO4865928.1 winged helix-turn-helix domain-containing protein [Cupriavidus sp. WGlv3]MCO4893583.1 winged helix-turn-helix domain-containing protein [Cupriavidus sp. WGtm5]ULX56181.1 DNA-binding protein [Cupriavidus taiwanensis]CAP63973.1 Replication protein A [Cupriavidus taiwanensis LMG 19424]SOY74572.1 Replication protein A [Cupriavidus taiwanensis]
MTCSFDGLPIARRTTKCGDASHAPKPVAAEGLQPNAARLDAGRLPERILRAIALVYESDGLRTLHITNRQVLATLVRFALNQKDPSALAFIKKATIAQHLGMSEATVYRALGALEDAGLIKRERQRRTRAQLEVVGRIGFSSKLLRCIGITSLQVQSTIHVPTRSDESGASTCLAPVNGVNKTMQSSTKKHPGPGSFLRIDGRAVPMDLAPLVRDQALKMSALFLLMKLARTTGHRLSDVVSAAGNALRPLRGRELFAYLKSLLEMPVDYGHIVRTRKLREDAGRAAEARATRERQQIAELVARYRGKRVSAPDGSTYEVDSASIVFIDRNGRRSSVGHDQARAWLFEMDRVACGSSSGPIQLTQPGQPSSVVARAAIETIRGLVHGRNASQELDCFGLGISKELATPRTGYGMLRKSAQESKTCDSDSVDQREEIRCVMRD